MLKDNIIAIVPMTDLDFHILDSNQLHNVDTVFCLVPIHV